MGEPRELVDAAQVGTALAVLSFVALLLALGFLVYGRTRQSTPVLRAAIVSAVLMLLFPLWVVYNRIEDYFGLDSVAALLINLALFAGLGVGGGLLLRRIWPQSVGVNLEEHSSQGSSGSDPAPG